MTDIALLSSVVREADRAITTAQLRATHPNLIPVSTTNNSLVAAAKNIRRELAGRFPRVRFTVRSARFAGGDSIRVTWTDGPTTEQVDAIIGKYRAGTFDGMTDRYEYTGSAWGDTFGCARYLHAERDFSDSLIARILARLHRYWCDPDVPVPTVADFRSGRLWGIRARCSDFGREVTVALRRHTFSV